MARYPTIAQNFGQGLQVGGALGEAWSSSRFRRGEGKLQEEFAARAEAEGKPLDAYAGEYEEALNALYRKSGAAKRGVTGDSGSAINVDAYNKYQTSLGRRIDRDAAQKYVGGDVQGGYGRRAEGAANLGNFEAAQTNAIGRDTVGATTGAIIGADDKTGRAGQVDPYALQQGIATTRARHGDAGGALAAQQGAEGSRYEVASALFGQIVPLLNDPTANADRIVGLFEGVKQYIPMAQDMGIAFDDKGVLNIFQNGKAIGSLDDPEEAMTIMAALQRDPRGTLAAWEQSRITAATAKGEHAREDAKAYRDARIDVVKEYGKAGGNTRLLGDISKAQETATKADWKNFQANEDGTVTAVAPTGELVTITQGRDSGVPGAERLSGFTITGADGGVRDQSELQGAAAAVDYAVKVQQAMGEVEDAAAASRLLETLGVLSAIESGQAPQLGARSRRGGTQTFPFKETDDYVRTIMGKAGQVSGSPREQAQQLMAALVQKESGGDHSAVSVKGARGLTQIMPATEGDPGYGVAPLRDNSPEEAMRFGEDYLTAMIEEFGSAELGLAAYNAGPGQVEKWLASGKVGQQAPAADRRVAQQTAAPARPTPGVPSGVPATAAAAAPALDVSVTQRRLAQFDEQQGDVDIGSAEGRARSRLMADNVRAHRAALGQQGLSDLRNRGASRQKLTEADLYSQYTAGDTAGAAPDPLFDDLILRGLGGGRRTIR